MKKIIAVLLILAVVVTGVFAQGQKDAAKTDEQKKIVFCVNETPILPTEFWQQASDSYMAKNPDVVVENIAQPSSNVMHRDFLKTLLATDQFPDVMVMASPADFVSSGALMALPSEKMDYLANPKAGAIDGESYVAIYKYQVGGFWYNKDIFKKLGLEVPQTYAELVNACKVIDEAGITPISMGLKDGWPQLVLASMLISADVLSEDADWGVKRNNNEVKFSDANVVKALEKYKELVTKYANKDMASVTYAQMLNLFFSGQAAMMPMGSWVQGEEAKVNPDFTVGFFPVPSDNNADTVSIWANEGLAINANTKYPEVCLDFVRNFFEDQNWYAKFLKIEMLIPSTKADVEYEKSDLRKEVGEKFANLRSVEHWYDMTGSAALLPGLQSYFNKMTQRIAMGSDVKEELKNYDAEWDFVNSSL